MSGSEHSSCTILLDDARSQPSSPTSRLYQAPQQAIFANNASGLELAITEIESALRQRKYVVACLSYELGEHLVGITPKTSSTPWVQAWVFDSVKKLSNTQVEQWLTEQTMSGAESPKIQDCKSSTTKHTYQAAINNIQDLIESGDTYQVNHTYRIHGQLLGSPLAAYQVLRKKQPGPYGAYIDSANGSVLSCSPEWFLQKEGQVLTTKPMKGTAKVGEVSSDELKNDSKNRAENLMIVDLLRNDLGKISIPGSIKVPELFEVNQHGDVLQMTSTISSTCKSDLSIKELLTAIFPCGSVTGAPKKRTMEIIQDLEDEPRGLYCGAIAWFDPSESNQVLGDLGMSVVIRTLEVNKDQSFTMGVGGGITIDSDGDDEWHECQTKAAFLYSLSKIDEPIGLFETVRIEKATAVYLELHIARLQKSAHHLNISFNKSLAFNTVNDLCLTLDPTLTYRLRIDLGADGQISLKATPISPLKSPIGLLWAKDILDQDTLMQSSDDLLQHKVTRRSIYDQAWIKAEELGSFDALFTNERGYVTEGGRSNIFIKKNGHWLTPPCSAGCLPGVMRSLLLKDATWQAIEQNITPDDVLNAEQIIFTNALRGIIKIEQ